VDATARSMSKHSSFRFTALFIEFNKRGLGGVFRGEPSDGDIPPDLQDLIPERLTKESLASWDPGLDAFRNLTTFQGGAIRDALETLPPEQVLVLTYEDILRQPEEEFGRLADFLELDDPASWSQEATALVRR
jgi:hypothetical protein